MLKDLRKTAIELIKSLPTCSMSTASEDEGPQEKKSLLDGMLDADEIDENLEFNS